MNLTKLFNYKYFKENIRKSRGLITLILFIVPVFTLLVTVLSGSNVESISIAQPYTIMTVNLLGMYVIPVLISFVLFGYVYKKTSVDFINSQPINRKSIFITNTIGGIVLISLIQVATAIILLLCNIFLSDIVIFSGMVFDIFILMWISYIFVFLATNVAMSVSGTFLTQIVLTMLMVFLVPFCVDSYKGFNNIERYYRYADIGEDNNLLNIQYLNDDYTTPYQTFHMLFSGNWYSSQSIIKMTALGIVYFFLGMYLFGKRKMENNEESFFDQRIHIFVKALTMLPMIIILNMIKGDIEFNIFAVALIITYYFIYDFIVKRKISFKTSIIYLILTLLILQGICFTAESIRDNLPNDKLNIENISAIKLNSYDYRYDDMINSSRFDYFSNYGIFTDNKEFIKTIFDSAVRLRKLYDSYNYTEENVINTIESQEYEPTAVVNMLIKTKANKQTRIRLELYKEDLDKALEILSNDEKYIKDVKNMLYEQGVLLVSNNYILTDKEKDVISEELKYIIENDLNKLFEKNSAEGAKICKYYYKNHDVNEIYINEDVSDKVLEIISRRANEQMVKTLGDAYGFTIISNTGEQYYLSYRKNEISKFIHDNAKEQLDVTKPYYIIKQYNRGVQYFYTNKIDELNQITQREEKYQEMNDSIDKPVMY